MTQGERDKAISTAVAAAAANPLVPAEIRVGLAAIAEELRELRGWLQSHTAGADGRGDHG